MKSGSCWTFPCSFSRAYTLYFLLRPLGMSYFISQQYNTCLFGRSETDNFGEVWPSRSQKWRDAFKCQTSSRTGNAGDVPSESFGHCNIERIAVWNWSIISKYTRDKANIRCTEYKLSQIGFQTLYVRPGGGDRKKSKTTKKNSEIHMHNNRQMSKSHRVGVTSSA